MSGVVVVHSEEHDALTLKLVVPVTGEPIINLMGVAKITRGEFNSTGIDRGLLWVRPHLIGVNLEDGLCARRAVVVVLGLTLDT